MRSLTWTFPRLKETNPLGKSFASAKRILSARGPRLTLRSRGKLSHMQAWPTLHISYYGLIASSPNEQDPTLTGTSPSEKDHRPAKRSQNTQGFAMKSGSQDEENPKPTAILQSESCHTSTGRIPNERGFEPGSMDQFSRGPKQEAWILSARRHRPATTSRVKRSHAATMKTQCSQDPKLIAKAPNKTGRRLKGRNQGNKSYMLEAMSRHLRSQVATETARVTSFHKPTRRIQIRRNFGATEKSPSAQSQQQTSKVQDGPCRRQMSGSLNTCVISKTAWSLSLRNPK